MNAEIRDAETGEQMIVSSVSERRWCSRHVKWQDCPNCNPDGIYTKPNA